MKSIIVTVTGQPRTGKDTLIEMIRGELLRDMLTEHIVVISSIDSAKDYLQRVAQQELGMSEQYYAQLNKTASEWRQGLSLVKQGLDMALAYTSTRPFVELERKPFSRILFYQVREIDNLERIRDIATVTSGSVIHYPIYVWAKNPPESGMADSDRPNAENFEWSERVENTYGPELRVDAANIALDLLRLYHGRDS